MSRRGRTARVASRQRIETLGNGTSAPTNKTIQTAETGELYFIDHNHASALTITLPPMQDGAYFKFIFKTALTEDGSVVIATSEATAGSIVGSIFEQVTGGSNAASGVDTDDGTDVKITLSDDIHPGSWVECFCDGSVWHAHARLNVSGVGESGFGDYSPPTPPNPPATKFYLGFQSAHLAVTDASSITKANIQGTTPPTAGGPGTFEPFPASPTHQINRIAYGKDGSGNPLIILLTSRETKSLFRIAPADMAPPDSASATNITSVGIQQWKVAWGNNVWISIGGQKQTGAGDPPTKKLFRSTDGTNWTTIDLSGLTDFPDVQTNVSALATNGTGKWWFGHYDETSTSRIYCSEDDGQTWALHHTLVDREIYRMAYTNDTLVVTYNDPTAGTGGRKAISALGSATLGASNWGTPVYLSPNNVRDLSNMISTRHGRSTDEDRHSNRIGAANGLVLVADTHNVLLLTVSGKNITVSDTLVALAGSVTNFNSNITSIVTDGEGNWYVGSTGGTGNGGDIAKNLNNADPASWTNGPTNLGSSERKIYSLAFDRYLPL